MLMQENFDLNSTQSYAVVLKEGLRKTMLDQEIIFRKQVQELHRLYRMQKILMEDINLKQFDRSTLKAEGSQSTWLFYSTNQLGREHEPSMSLIEDTNFCSAAMVGSTHTKSQVLPDSHNSAYYRIHWKPLGLHLQSDQCTSHLDQDGLNLSLRVVEEERRTNAATSACFDRKDKSCTQNIIDLEVSTEGISDEEENRAACLTSATMTKCESQISVISGFQDSHKAPMVKKSSMKDCMSHDAGKLDLNQVQLDDSSCYSSDNLVTSHSTASSLHIFGISFDRTPETTCPSTTWRKESSKCHFDASDIVQGDDAVNSLVMDSNNISGVTDTKCKGFKKCAAGLTGTKVVSSFQNKYIATICKLSGGQLTDQDGTYMATEVVNCENSKDDEFLSACQCPTEEKEKDDNVPPALCEPSCIDNSSSIKSRQPQINLGDTNVITHDHRLGTGDGNELGHDCSKKVEPVEPPEVAMCIQTAAQLLINFSVGSSSSSQDCSSKAESIKVDKKGTEKPVCSDSYDSYEQIALQLEECNADDCSVSSKPYEIDSMGKTDFGFRLKRGRRFKDFQKDVLPGLASLSRHEIQEDINILEGVLRSREYRKMRARMGDQTSWCVPSRSRRSKRNYVRRKLF